MFFDLDFESDETLVVGDRAGLLRLREMIDDALRGVESGAVVFDVSDGGEAIVRVRRAVRAGEGGPLQ